MKYFGLAWRFARDHSELLERAREMGLEVRQGEYFFDPQTKHYNDGLREEFRQINERTSQEVEKIENNDPIVHEWQCALGITAYLLFHPRMYLRPNSVLKD